MLSDAQIARFRAAFPAPAFAVDAWPTCVWVKMVPVEVHGTWNGVDYDAVPQSVEMNCAFDDAAATSDDDAALSIKLLTIEFLERAGPSITTQLTATPSARL